MMQRNQALLLVLQQALLAVLIICSCGGPRPAAAAGPSAQQIPASPNVVQLNEYSFQGRISDGRVWFVEFYADWCRGCRHVAGHVDQLADTLEQTSPHIVVARLDCGGDAEAFCDRVIQIQRTPEFKVYHRGKLAMTYRSEFYFIDMMLPFISRIAADLLGFSLPSAAPLRQTVSSAAQDDDSYVYHDDDEDDDNNDREDNAATVPATPPAAGCGADTKIDGGDGSACVEVAAGSDDLATAAAADASASDASFDGDGSMEEDEEASGGSADDDYNATEAAAEKMLEGSSKDDAELIIV